jgi:hypothetical protein
MNPPSKRRHCNLILNMDHGRNPPKIKIWKVIYHRHTPTELYLYSRMNIRRCLNNESYLKNSRGKCGSTPHAHIVIQPAKQQQHGITQFTP